jgi:hypothetical protein
MEREHENPPEMPYIEKTTFGDNIYFGAYKLAKT